MSIIDNYKKIKEGLERIAASAGRDKEEIKIVAVTKTFPAATVQEAIDSGISLIGENKIQEAKAKAAELKGNFALHLIGHLQSNKARDAVRLFDVIHSIDKLSTAVKIDEEAAKINKIQKILVQVNTSGEDTKSGVQPADAIDLCAEILKLRNIELLGLMTIGPFSDDGERVRNSFGTLRNLLAEINMKLGIRLRELSMGMTSDYATAVQEGATIVRIGSAIFGNRNYT
ncbi:MAG: YggS family pyridoxal phosphate-dependent enzyme [Spirochaetes bacterium]|jgi:hypothetical protein|nr:YggS family pyridoxal phosphate-dependent enzyme [Spirochaetota bacterium]